MKLTNGNKKDGTRKFIGFAWLQLSLALAHYYHLADLRKHFDSIIVLTRFYFSSFVFLLLLFVWILLTIFTDNYVVAWKRGIAILSAGSVKVTPDPRVHLVNGFSLQIKNAVPQDAGDYVCQIATLEPREITHTVEILGKCNSL